MDNILLKLNYSVLVNNITCLRRTGLNNVNCSILQMDKNKICTTRNVKLIKDNYKKVELFLKTVTIKRKGKTSKNINPKTTTIKKR